MSTAVFASKSSRDRRRDITRAAAGKDLVIQRMTPGKSVVNSGEAPDHVHSPGPNASNYEKFRAHSGAHLVFNAFLEHSALLCARDAHARPNAPV
jgi:hypothetical protein